MTNIEKVKRILDAGHWVRFTTEDYSIKITSYIEDSYSFIEDWVMYDAYMSEEITELWTIEVIQRIPTPYKAGEKVLVLSNPEEWNENIESMVWNVCKIRCESCTEYMVWTWEDTYEFHYFPSWCIAPSFDDEKDTDLKLSWKEVTVTIDGKEYTAVMK